MPKRELRVWGKQQGWEPKPGKVKQGAAGTQHHPCSVTAAAMPKADGGTMLNRKEL